MINYVNNVVPMMTQPLQEFSTDKDVRFTKVKIWLMHMGKNLNGSIFNKSVVEKAIPSLANTPIVGSTLFKENGEEDFSGHGIDVKVSEDGEVKLVNTTIPYGVIPADNKAQFETRLCDDGIEREFLTCEGLLWNKWDEAVDIIVNKAGVTGQSMELDRNYSGNFSDGNFEFTDFKFNGACLLGKDETPAMTNSTVEMIFSAEAQEYIQNKLDLYNTYSFNNEEGGTPLEDNKEKVTFEGEENTDTPETPEKEPETGGEQEPETPVDEGNNNEGKDSEGEETPKEQPLVSAEENAGTVNRESDEDLAKVRTQAREEAATAPNPKDEILVLDKLFTAKDIEKLLADKAKIEQELFALKASNHKEKADALFTQYDAHLSVEETNSLKEKVADTSLEDLKTQIFSIIGMKSLNNYTASNQTKNEDIKDDTAPIFTALDVNKTDKPESKYGDLFKEYLGK